MTTIETIRAELAANGTLTGLVGTRIYPQVLAQEATVPAIVLSVVSEVPQNTLTGTTERLRMSRVQVDCYATTYLGAHQVADAADAVLSALMRHDLSAQRENFQDIYDDAAQLHRVSSDYLVALSP